MSQLLGGGDGGAPGVPGIESITGNDGNPTFGSGSPVNVNIVGDTAQGVSVDQTAADEETVTVADATAGATAGDASKGVSSYDSADFTVVNGFVSLAAQTFTGSGQTVGATTDDILTVPLGAVAGTFQFEARVKAFESGTPTGAGYNIYATFITDGATATLIGQQPIFNESVVLEDADAYFVASGNNAVLQVLGVTGLTIEWDGETEIT